MRLRSLTFKLMLAFLFVGLIGAGLVASFVSHRTKDEFNRFMLNREQSALIEDLADYYRFNQNWQAVDQLFLADDAAVEAKDESHWFRRRGHGPPPAGTLVDANGAILWSQQTGRVGDKIARNELTQGVPVRLRDKVVGWFIFDDLPAQATPPVTPEQAFLKNVQQAILVGAVGATLAALVVGVFLAQTLTRPIRELTTATKVVAEGQLGHQVKVRSKDELGDLATSFNQMSRDLAQANQLRRQMTADIAHDLRTPLSILLGYTEALSDGKLAGTMEIHQVMHREAQHLSHLIDDLRTLSLADADELALNLQVCLPYELLTRTAAAYQGQAGPKNITLTVQSSRDLPPVMVDPDRMAQVLGNLVSNALRYTPAAGQITLSAEADETEVILCVQDTGSGIPPEELPYIFDRFYRADASRQQSNGESGLGLAIARSIVAAHNGIISVDSLLDNGTTFTIRLKQAESVEE